MHSDKHCLTCRRERYRSKRLPRKTTEQRFWEKVDLLSGDCWEWKGAVQKHYGHGSFWDGERTGLAHRYAWRLFFGLIPDGLEVCHHCDNPACVRPDHLFLGTHADNMRDMGRKMRRAEKLTREDILYIRKSNETRADLARKLGVSRTLIIKVLQGKIYRDIM